MAQAGRDVSAMKQERTGGQLTYRSSTVDLPFDCCDESSDRLDGDAESDLRLDEEAREVLPRVGQSPAFNHGGSGCDDVEEGGKRDREGADD